MANSLAHWELAVSDVAKAKQFYGAVFDWKFDESRMPGYVLIDTGAGPPGGMMLKPPGAPAPALETYFRVADIAKTLHTVVERGGRVIVPETAIPRVGWFAMFLDPDGIPIGVFRHLEPMPPGN